jgi:hypothetical protein
MKRELLTPLIVAGLAVAFVIVSAMVLLTRNPRWIQRKLRIGALLLGLTAVVSCGDETISCYDPVMPNYFQLGENYGGIVNVDLSESQTLSGTIHERQGEVFSYRLENAAEEEVARENIAALDGAFDESSEEFEITLPGTLVAGSYHLELFGADADAQPEYANTEFTLEVTD